MVALGRAVAAVEYLSEPALRQPVSRFPGLEECAQRGHLVPVRLARQALAIARAGEVDFSARRNLNDPPGLGDGCGARPGESK